MGGSGNDTLSGLSGDDFIIVDEQDSYFNGGTGDDTLSFESAADSVNLFINEDRHVEWAGVVTDVSSFESFVGSAFSDSFHIYAHSEDSFSGLAGNDFFALWSGNDHLIFGGEGNDEFYVYGGDGAIISGGEGDDFFFSTHGANTFEGGLGNDQFLAFSPLREVFIFSDGEGSDEIRNFQTGIDVIHVNTADASSVTTHQRGDGLVLMLGESSEIFLHDVFDFDSSSDLIFL
ncbi:hypothetical protein A8B78_11070 [Jannaschia sp. EhC01]|nr:hypothetical protein A8B78_11070 [Jannaschia sp. EhC01]